MNEQLAKLLSKLNDGADFINGQLPDIANQIVIGATIEAFCFLAAALLLLLVTGVLVFMVVKEKFSENFGPFILAGIFGFFGFILLFGSINDLAKCKFAPKTVVIEYLKGVVK